MKEVLILERSAAPISNYSKKKTEFSYLLEGIFTEFNRLNRNNRIYTADDFLPHLNEMNGRIQEFGGVYGELDHPSIYETKLQNASHLITSATYDSNDNLVRGQIRLTPNKLGRDVRALIDEEFPVFVSSRAVGVMESQNRVSLKKLFTYDVVGDPGFGSAKMNMVGFNESAAFNEAADPLIKIFDFIQESAVQDLVTMNNNNDSVSRVHLKEMYDYITEQIADMKKEFASGSSLTSEELQAKLERFENLEANNAKLQAYIKYFSEQFSLVSVQKEALEKTNEQLINKVEKLTEKIVETASTVDNVIKFTEETASHVAKNVAFTEHIAGHVQNNIKFTESVAGHVQNNIKFTENVAGNLKHAIGMLEETASHVDNSIKFTESVASNQANAILFSEHIAHQLKDQAKATRILEEGLNASILYSESLAQNIMENAEYENYLAKCMNGINDFCEDVAVKLNGTSINEAVIEISSPVIPAIEDTFGAEEEEVETEEETTDALLDTDTVVDGGDATEVLDNPISEEPADFGANAPVEDAALLSDDTAVAEEPIVADDAAVAELPSEEVIEPTADLSNVETGATTINVATDGSVTISVDPSKLDTVSEEPVVSEEPIATEEPVISEEPAQIEEFVEENAANTKGSELSSINIDESDVVSKSFIDKIGELINEAKKRKAASNEVPHFFEFMTEGQIKDFKALSLEDQEKVKVLAETREYFSEEAVLDLIKEALEVEQPSVYETLVTAVPEDLKEEWEALTESRKVEILNATRFYDVSNPGLIENFWRTRPLVETASSINNDFFIKNETIQLQDLAEDVDLKKALDNYKKLF
jgi:hypothetical protein